MAIPITIQTAVITVADPTNPTELTTFFANTTITAIYSVAIVGNWVFLIVYS